MHCVVWDLFFLKGIVVIIRFALNILSLMEEELLQCQSFGDIFLLIDNYCQERLDIRTLLEKFADRISLREFEKLRAEKREEIMTVLKPQMEATQKSIKGMAGAARAKFAGNFQLY